MKFLQKIRENLGFSLLCKNARKLVREKAFHNFKSANTVGLIFDASLQKNYLAASSLMKELSGKGKEVSGLGMVVNQEMLKYFPDSGSLKFFRSDDLTFLGYPKDKQVGAFIKQPFDLLLNLCVEESLCSDYVVAMSKAKMKVSMNLKSDDFADFILQYNTKPETENLIVKIKEYLSALDKR